MEVNIENIDKFLKIAPADITKEHLHELKDYLRACDIKWAESVRMLMRDEPVFKARYSEEDGLMPLNDVYRLSSGIITNPVLRGLYVKNCVAYIQEITSKVA